MTSGPPRRIVVVQGHPDPGGRHFGHALADAYASGAREAGHSVDRIDVAGLELPFARSSDDLERGPVPEPVRRAQSVLLGADHVVVFYPVWNGTSPAVLRAFFEQVFRSSFVFPDAKPGEKLGFMSAFTQKKALAGKTARVVATMQMPAFVYRLYFHPHPEKNTLVVSGFEPVRETLIGSVDSMGVARRERWLETVRRLGCEGR